MGVEIVPSGSFVPLLAVAVGAVILLVPAGAAVASFTSPLVMGYPTGDDWEPAVASDGLGNVYVVSTHIGGVPGCGGCGNPSMMVQASHDGGRSFTRPTPLFVSSAAQFDPQVKVNAAGTSYVSYLLGKDAVVQRSTDRGATWSPPVVANVGMRQGLTDKDGLAVRDDDVYVAFNVAQRFFVASSHDGGQGFRVVQINQNTIGWTINGGGAVDPKGNVYFSWVSVHQSGNARGLQDVLIAKSTDGGVTWSVNSVDTNLPPGPPCGWPTSCGWDFLGPSMAIAADGAGAIHVLYNAGLADQGSPYVWYRTSTDGGVSWSARARVSADGTNAYHVFPAIAAGAAGDVRISWMDNRTGAYNVWYRSSSDGGQTWARELQISQVRSGYGYVTPEGFAFSYGDYFVLNLDPKGTVHIAWGEGPSFNGPGNVLYAHN